MNSELKEKWVAALRSGNYKQGIHYLRNRENEFCCLGVLCDIIAPNDWDNNYTASGCIQHKHNTDGVDSLIFQLSGLDHSKLIELVRMNDKEKRSFPEIASHIENNIPITGDKTYG